MENIALGEYDPDMEGVLDLAGELGTAEFVEQLPEGYRTMLGENGALLSGGQRQRIAIARALYRSPQVLILDEATSSLDSASERFVQRAVRRLRDEGRTVVVIAHRLSTIRDADRIVVLEGGRVSESGTHAELLVRRGSYARHWRDQFTTGEADADWLPAAPPAGPRTTAHSPPVALPAGSGD